MKLKNGEPAGHQVSSHIWPKRAEELRQLSVSAAKRLTGTARDDLWFAHVYENCLPGDVKVVQQFCGCETAGGVAVRQ